MYTVILRLCTLMTNYYTSRAFIQCTVIMIEYVYNDLLNDVMTYNDLKTR